MLPLPMPIVNNKETAREVLEEFSLSSASYSAGQLKWEAKNA